MKPADMRGDLTQEQIEALGDQLDAQHYAALQSMIAEDIAYMSAGTEGSRMHEPGSPFCDAIGFTDDRFHGYLFEDGSVCWLSLVVSKQPGQGHFSEVLDALKRTGMEIRVPTPFPDMQAILLTKGFGPVEKDEHGCEMMRLPGTCPDQAASRAAAAMLVVDQAGACAKQAKP